MFNVSITTIEENLQIFTVYYEIVPWKGHIDHVKLEIVVNPIFNLDAEILMHELLHHLFPEVQEGFILEGAREIIENHPDIKIYLEAYCKTNAKRRGSLIFGLF